MSQDSTFSLKFAARFQSLFIADGIINDDGQISDGSSTFLIRRSRLKFDGYAYTPKLKYKLEIGLSNRDISGASDQTRGADRMILDAVIMYNFYKGFSIWAGQTKLPGNRERVISSGNLQFVDRSLVNSRFNIDRDMGIQIRHKHKLGKMELREMFSVSQGEGRNVTASNHGGLDYTSRIEVLPFGAFKSKGDYVGSAIKREDSPKLAIGLTYDFHDRAVRQRGQLGSYIQDDEGEYITSSLETIFLDMMFKYKGISVMVEYADKKGDNVTALDSEGVSHGFFYTGTGLTTQLGYMLKSNWELAGRVTTITPQDTIGQNDTEQYTFGVSKYIVGHKLKVQTDFSYTQEENENDAVMMRLQFDLHF
ncbi:MAG: porin [Flavobacteriales bacterium]